MNKFCDARPMIGNEDIARAAWETDVMITTTYPETPSTKILE